MFINMELVRNVYLRILFVVEDGGGFDRTAVPRMPGGEVHLPSVAAFLFYPRVIGRRWEYEWQ